VYLGLLHHSLCVPILEYRLYSVFYLHIN
jgi:hypothetical protein